MTPLVFRRGEREMVGLLHQGSGPLGLVVCGPYGQESSRVARLQRVLCDKAERFKVSSLRFDLYGCGESMGHDDEGDLAGWEDDLIAADQTLRERSGCTRVAWFGMRLGATLAARAAARAPRPPHALLLWEPVLDGARYLETLREDLQRMTVTGYGPSAWHALAPAAPDDAGGYRMGETLRAQLQTLVLERLAAEPPATLIVNAGETPRYAHLGAARTLELNAAMDWIFVNEAIIPLVPADALNALLKELRSL